MKLQELGKSLLSKSLWTVLGRKNMARLGRFLSNEARLDLANDPHTNGEYLLQQLCLNNFKQKDTLRIFDVGANVGDWSKNFARQAQEAGASFELHAFEPFPGTFSTLKKNIARMAQPKGQITPHNLALSDENGASHFFSLGDNVGTNSLHKPDPSLTTQQVETVKVHTQTLDSFCQDHGIEQIHLLKIDTEGHDASVLQGAQGMLQNQAIHMLQFEYNARWILAHKFLRDVFLLLEPFGYKLGKITPKGIEFYDAWHFELETFREANFLATLPQHRALFPQLPWWNQ